MTKEDAWDWFGFSTKTWIAKDIHELLAVLKRITTCKDYPITTRATAMAEAYLLNELVCDERTTKRVFRKERLSQ